MEREEKQKKFRKIERGRRAEAEREEESGRKT